MKLFGFEIVRPKSAPPQTVVAPLTDDGATTIESAAAGYYAQVIELEGKIKNENDLIRRYREVSQYPDCDAAIEDIINEAIVADDTMAPVEINLDEVELSTSIKKKIIAEFEEVSSLLKFNSKGHDVFRNWYVDGRIYYHIVVDEENPKNGILELRPVDPRKIRKIKNIKKDKNKNGVDVVVGVEEYYMFNDSGITETAIQGIKLPVDSIIYVPSGIIDANSGMVMGYLHKSIKLVNQLKMMEDALVIYRISRAPERRIFYVDVGNLPKHKAEQYVNDLMVKFKNKVVYDASSGEVKDDRRHLSMMEDFWMPRREGGKGTEITTLPGGQTLGEIEDIEFFQRKLFQSLNVPMSRLKGEDGFSLGRATEISRDEIKFNKFVQRIRKKFSNLFLDTLRIQLLLKGIINIEEWDEIENDIRFDYMRDNYFSELKEAEILQNRINTLLNIDQYVGKYYSTNWVRKNVLMLSDEDIEEIAQDLEEDRKDELEFAKHEGALERARSGEDEYNDNDDDYDGGYSTDDDQEYKEPEKPEEPAELEIPKEIEPKKAGA